MGAFIPNFHFDSASEKLTSAWAMKVVNYYGRNTNNKGLLWGKNIDEVEQYYSGDIDMRPFMQMYKSLSTSVAAQNQNPNYKGDPNMKNGMVFEPFAIIPEKVTSAVATLSKVPTEISCKATDALAMEKKKKDIEFLKNKPVIEADLQEIADSVNLGKIDLGATKHGAEKYSDSPYGLDLNEPDEENIFANLIYTLGIEAAFETILKSFFILKNINQIKLLEIQDQFKWAVSCNRTFQNSLTGLPDCEYVHPADVEIPFSLLPDCSDRSHNIIHKYCTVTELFDAFGSQIGSKEDLDNLIIGTDAGSYCSCNDLKGWNRGNYDTAKIHLQLFEVKSIDWVGLSDASKSKKGYRFLTTDENETKDKIWIQNTYYFWWLTNTDKCFDIGKLGFAERTLGQESYQNFTTNIYRSKRKSAVEMAIGENKKAQRADIKLQHAVIKSLPPGWYIDLRFLRNGLTGTTEGVTEAAMNKVLAMGFEQNTWLGDTTDFDGKNDGQFKPIIHMPGGLGQEILGYANIIAAANINVGRIMGINEQLTGQSANPEGLIGLQKLLINSSINGINYVSDAIGSQYQKVFSNWTNCVKDSVERGGASKEAIIKLIGASKANLIDQLDDAGLHSIGVFVKIGQREEERARYDAKLGLLIQQGVISAADEFLLSEIDNPKERYAVLAAREVKFKKQKAKELQDQYAQQQTLAKQQGDNIVAGKQAEAAGEKELVYAKGDVSAKILQLSDQLGLGKLQAEGILQMNLQREKSRSQMDKNIGTLKTKSDLKQQEALI